MQQNCVPEWLEPWFFCYQFSPDIPHHLCSALSKEPGSVQVRETPLGRGRSSQDTAWTEVKTSSVASHSIPLNASAGVAEPSETPDSTIVGELLVCVGSYAH